MYIYIYTRINIYIYIYKLYIIIFTYANIQVFVHIYYICISLPFTEGGPLPQQAGTVPKKTSVTCPFSLPFSFLFPTIILLFLIFFADSQQVQPWKWEWLMRLEGGLYRKFLSKSQSTWNNMEQWEPARIRMIGSSQQWCNHKWNSVVLSCLADRYGGQISVLIKPFWVQIAAFFTKTQKSKKLPSKFLPCSPRFRNFTRFSQGFGNFINFSPSFDILPGFGNFTRFSPCFDFAFDFTAKTDKFHQQKWKTLLLVNFHGVKRFLNYIISPGFHQVLAISPSFHKVLISPGLGVWNFSKKFTRLSPGCGNSTRFSPVFTQFSPSFHQVFTKL